jgi:hypothetical protein
VAGAASGSAGRSSEAGQTTTERAAAEDREEDAKAREVFHRFCREWSGRHASSVDAEGFVELCRRLRLLAPMDAGRSMSDSQAVTAVVAEQIHTRCKGPGSMQMAWQHFQQATKMIGVRTFPGTTQAGAWMRIRRVLWAARAIQTRARA